MYCFIYCSVDTVLVIGSVVHVDTEINTATIVAPEAPAVHLKVGDVGVTALSFLWVGGGVYFPR